MPCGPTPPCNRRALSPRFYGLVAATNRSCSITPMPSCRTRLMAIRWAACGLWTVFVWVRFAILRVCSARRAVIPGKRLCRLIYNRRTAISLAHSCFVRRSFVAVNLVQPNTALQPTALSGRFHHFVVAWSFARFILFLLSRAAAER